MASFVNPYSIKVAQLRRNFNSLDTKEGKENIIHIIENLQNEIEEDDKSLSSSKNTLSYLFSKEGSKQVIDQKIEESKQIVNEEKEKLEQILEKILDLLKSDTHYGELFVTARDILFAELGWTSYDEHVATVEATFDKETNQFIGIPNTYTDVSQLYETSPSLEIFLGN
jgi:glutamine synthetase adenylyltransferase